MDSWRIVKFSTHSVMFYDSDMKQVHVRNSYEYSRDSCDSAGFGLSDHDIVPNLLRCAIKYLEILK